jgi:hypothetical protein
MRALDSYRERLRTSARLRTQREEGIGKMQAEAEQLLCGFGRPHKAERQPSHSRLAWRARKGGDCELVAAARSSLRRRTTAAHRRLHRQSSRITSSVLFCLGASFVIRLKVAACRVEFCARSGCDTQTPANLLKAAPTPVLMIFPPTWLGCDGPRI